MSAKTVCSWLALFVLIASMVTAAQTTSAVPRLIKYTGTIADAQGVVGVTFALYTDQSGGTPLWTEIQNVQLTDSGSFTVFLGATSSEGLPFNLFSSGEARWLGVQAAGQPEQPRVLLVSVPYAMKAANADTLAGQPAVSYVQTDNLKQQVTTAFQNDLNQLASTLIASSTLVAPAVAVGNGSFSADTADQVMDIKQTGAGKAIYASSSGTGLTNATIHAVNNATSGVSFAIVGVNSNPTGFAIRGEAQGKTAANIGVWGVSLGTGGTGILGEAASATGYTYGLRGKSASVNGTGLMGDAQATSGNNTGIFARVFSPTGTGLKIEAVNPLTTGKLFRAINAGTEKFSIDGGGNLATAGSVTSTAGTFIGDGSGLYNINAAAVGGVPASALGTVRSITFGSGLTGGTITSSGTVGVDFSVLDSRYITAGGLNTAALISSGGISLPGGPTAPSASGPLDMGATVADLAGNTLHPTFRWQVTPQSTPSSSPGGRFDLTYAQDGTNFSNALLTISKTGLITFASGQTFPLANSPDYLNLEATVINMGTAVGAPNGTATLDANGKVSASQLPAPAIIGGAYTASQNSNVYVGMFGASGSTTLSHAQMPMPVSGTISKFSVRVSNAPGASKDWTFAINVNGVDQTATNCQIASSAFANTCDIPVSISAGDLVTVHAIPSGNPANTLLFWTAVVQ